VSRTVYLFDIDGTLLTCGGAGRKALERTFHALHERADALESFKLDGMTDRAIARQALQAIGREPTPESIDLVLARYVEFLDEEIAKIEASKYRVHDGMHDAVAAARKLGAAVGLGTGNIRHGAMLKLKRVGLHEAFAFGGFGDDHEQRPELIRKGAQRGVEQLGLKWDEARVLVIGDTPADVAAAHAIGGKCLAVATGRFSVAELRAAGADWAFESLVAPGALEALLGVR
jgi:phosphoglycolate phosphatase-like HAD superfamily hydrolase